MHWFYNIMLDWDINHHLYKILVKISFQISTMIYETWIGTKNYQTMRIFYVHCNMHSRFTTSKDLKHGSNNNASMLWALLVL
jgi:hypothetical protein